MQHDAHRPVGKGISADTDSNGATWVTSSIADEQAKKFLRKGILTAYSIGMRYPVVETDPTGRYPGGIIKSAQLAEISLVDSPSNVNAGITILKSSGNGSAQFVGKAFMSKQAKQDRKMLEKAIKGNFSLDALKPSKKASKAERREMESYLRSLLNSDDPSMREAARKALGL